MQTSFYCLRRGAHRLVSVLKHGAHKLVFELKRETHRLTFELKSDPRASETRSTFVKLASEALSSVIFRQPSLIREDSRDRSSIVYGRRSNATEDCWLAMHITCTWRNRRRDRPSGQPSRGASQEQVEAVDRPENQNWLCTTSGWPGGRSDRA